MSSRVIPVLLSLCFACTGAPTEADIAARVLAGDIDGARKLAAQVDSPWAAPLTEELQIAYVRDQAHRVEWEWTNDELREALADKRGRDALTALTAGIGLSRALHRSAEPFALRTSQVLASHDDPVAAHRTLLEAWQHDPDRWQEQLEQLRAAQLRARYAPAGFAHTRGQQAGITVDMAVQALSLISDEYITEVDSAELLAGARTQLVALAAVMPDGACTATDVSIDLDQGFRQLVASCAAPAEVAVDEATKGALATLDPHTRVIWPKEVAAWDAYHSGVVYGVGLVLDQDDAGDVRVQTLRPDSPAFAANLHVGDRVVRLDDVRLDQLAADARGSAVNNAIRGPDGTRVEIEVERGTERITVDLERQAIAVEVIAGVERTSSNGWQWWLDEDAGIGYVRISAFRAHTDDELGKAIDAWGDRLRGVIVDLRGNPGGDVNASAVVADRWIVSGEVARLEGRRAPNIDEGDVPWNLAVPGDELEGVPTVVLVDSATASAAELVAGALQELAGAKIVGERTYGKGLSQGLRTGDGFAVTVTNSWWALPGGRVLHRTNSSPGGLAPDVAVDLTPVEALQIRMRRDAAEVLRVHADGSPVPWEDSRAVPELIPELIADPILSRGRLVLDAMLASAPQPTD